MQTLTKNWLNPQTSDASLTSWRQPFCNELIRFENDMQDLLRDIKFKHHQSEFEKKLARDVKEIKSSKPVNIYIYIYLCSSFSYNKCFTTHARTVAYYCPWYERFNDIYMGSDFDKRGEMKWSTQLAICHITKNNVEQPFSQWVHLMNIWVYLFLMNAYQAPAWPLWLLVWLGGWHRSLSVLLEAIETRKKKHL